MPRWCPVRIRVPAHSRLGVYSLQVRLPPSLISQLGARLSIPSLFPFVLQVWYVDSNGDAFNGNVIMG